ncbi:glycosyltransferase family 4 protein [Streptomyces tsukubensis]|uniref:D-inositol 3-phosphate glycosyltransferase n=1 Tax=Streptomyces tsukubensis TaxID=83656 RepID=A0A1V3ZZK6_9ACTN|nr:glycosyltransferase family 4 protein [Streptomyces tsukubensis]OON71586.1 hypothetical protein B1H18_33280 [Streptomyces tsukubensis]
MKITFLLYNAYGIGGTIRATANLATALARRHEVEIVSCYRTADALSLPAGPGVSVRDLVDLRPRSVRYAGDEPDQRVRGKVCPDDAPQRGASPPSKLGEDRLAAFLRTTDADVVIATRPYLVCFLAEHGRADYLRVGQEHLTHDFHRDILRRDQNAAIEQLDAFVTVSEGDANAYRRALPEARTHLTHIPNCCPAPDVEGSDGTSRTVVAAGRLIPVKHYERLIDAFQKVAAQHPDWTLRIYGRGKERAKLRGRIDELGLNNHVFLMGPSTPIDPEWAKGAIAAVSSSTESFGMTIVEAMRLGVPVVSTDCDYGPREIITHGHDGLLVPVDGAVEDALADALTGLIADDAGRLRMAEAARVSARRFLPERIAEQYEELITGLRPDLAEATTPAPRPTAPSPPVNRGARRLASRLRAVALPGRVRTPVEVGCRAGADGSLVFRLPRPAGRGPWEVVLTHRDGDSEGGPLILPLEPVARGDDERAGGGSDEEKKGREAREGTGEGAAQWGRERGSEAVLPRGELPLAEGHWDVHVRRGRRGAPRPARAGLIETSQLIGHRPPHPSGAGCATAIPYTAKGGTLAVRAWHRAAHAEVTGIDMSSTAITFAGTLHGVPAPLGPYRLAGRLRGGAGPLLRVPCDIGEDGRFTARVPLDLVAEQCDGAEAVWDLRLDPYDSRAGRGIRAARLFGDVVERGRTDIHPAVQHPTPQGPFTFQPYFTVNNNLALRARAVGGTTGL